MVFTKLRPDRAEDQGIVSTIDKDVSNKWKWVWLKEETKTKVTLDNNKEREVKLVVGDSICKINIPGSAYCNWCCDTLKYGGKGKNALISHLTTKKHLGFVKTRLTTSALGSFGASVSVTF